MRLLAWWARFRGVVVLMLGPLWAESHLAMAALLNLAPDMVDLRHAFAASAGQPR